MATELNINPLRELLKQARVLVCVGSGGVGKTTIAASLGVEAALLGRQTLVMTIDPSQRLKTTFNLKESGEVSEVNLPEKASGTLSASVLNSKVVFDEFIMRAAKKETSAQKLFNNKLYQQLSTNLAGSQEFTALEKLYHHYESGKYDLIILDTPPAKHAMDFLTAPQRLSALFNDSVARWFREADGGRPNFLANVFQGGTKRVLKILETLTGSEFMKELAEFFVSIQSWQGNLEQRIGQVHSLLTAEATKFMLVSSFDKSKLVEAKYFAQELRKGGYELGHLFMNRSYPEWSLSYWGIPNRGLLSANHVLVEELNKRLAYYEKQRELMQEFAKSLTATSGAHPIGVHFLPELSQDISDIEGLYRLRRFLKLES